jgi:hypothetical protein
MQIKITLRFYLNPVRIPVIRNTTINSSKDMGKKEHLYTVGGNVN